MVKRVAYIGLSGPAMYDYKQKHMLDQTYPNPILEAPMGIAAFYDEIVFLDRKLCPKSMQKLDFVKFLTDSEDMDDLVERFIQAGHMGRGEPNYMHLWDYGGFPFDELRAMMNKIAPFAIYDNHSRELMVGSNPFSPNAALPKNVLFDTFVAKDGDMTLITNSLIDKTLRRQLNSIAKGRLTEIVLSPHVPNYLDIDGPDVNTMNQVRNAGFLKQFREKIDDTILGNKDDSVERLAQGLEDEFDEIRDDLASRLLDRARIYDSAASTTVAVLSEFVKVLPGIGTAASSYQIARDWLEIWEDRDSFGWAGFLLELRRKKRLTKNPK